MIKNKKLFDKLFYIFVLINSSFLGVVSTISADQIRADLVNPAGPKPGSEWILIPGVVLTLSMLMVIEAYSKLFDIGGWINKIYDLLTKGREPKC